MIKGYYQKPKAPPTPTLTGGIESIFQTVNELNTTKKEVLDKVDAKISEVENKIENGN